MIIDLTYLNKEPLFLPNIGEQRVNRDDEYLVFIDKYEFQFLLLSLGFELAKELLDQFEADGSWKPSAEQKWKDLVDGKDNWQGLRFSVGEFKQSMIANYVYCQYLYESDRNLTAVGSVVDDVEKGHRLSNWSKFVNAWREMIEMRQERKKDGTLSLKEYLKENKSDFRNYKFQELNNVNTFCL